MKSMVPTEIHIISKRQLALHYGTEIKHISAYSLRLHSLSALERGHGRKKLTETNALNFQFNNISEDIEILEINIIGNYALKVTFSDGHDSGLYDWEYLYKLAA